MDDQPIWKTATVAVVTLGAIAIVASAIRAIKSSVKCTKDWLAEQVRKGSTTER